ncbi:hypothetical protein SDJN03_15813, partial [Cucurbita argyrosperma subsp. sororia]
MPLRLFPFSFTCKDLVVGAREFRQVLELSGNAGKPASRLHDTPKSPPTTLQTLRTSGKHQKEHQQQRKE